ncbi:hypothetical protein LBMAG56_20050 [Verrucomicrobiota bacterium]|nr:hypothetical protein LBMAG56_20050 [Verrucomicrobiota bacterium]
MSDLPSTATAPQKTDPAPVIAGAEKSAAAAAASSPVPAEKLTPEEQMALFEKSLKEEDWGHQPC